MKIWEYILFYFNDQKIPTTKELTDKNIRNLKTFVSIFYVLQIIYLLGTIGTVFVSLLVAAENKEIFNISSFVCSVFLFFNTTFLILLRKVCQVYIGTNRQKQKSDWLFFFY
ncbi:hypothetical protein [Mycoplasma procyoni]|uniref:hypothetical protein n=1 Tax=Mycoplasma procyoni TaxID=568784 RepID=UPI00197C7AC0|nr:hypothetical protein [Mycoplasma procyoni]MBN3534718.1 hypothetical protein [Mycoplasma procyoni]